MTDKLTKAMEAIGAIERNARLIDAVITLADDGVVSIVDKIMSKDRETGREVEKIYLLLCDIKNNANSIVQQASDII